MTVAHWSTTVTAPHYISENKSDMRGIKSGWYAMEDDGKPFFWTVFQLRGMRQQNHSADKRGDGVQVAIRAVLKHSSSPDIWR
jgi:hypothetical protein